MHRQGFTILELLVVLAISAVLMSLGWSQFRPPEARLFASSLRAQVQQARFEAIKRNRPVAVVWNSQQNAFITQVDSSETATALPCTGTSLKTLLRTATAEYRTVRVENPFTLKNGARGVVWYPNGRVRLCDNSVIASRTPAAVRDARTTVYVRVASSGRVDLSDVP